MGAAQTFTVLMIWLFFFFFPVLLTQTFATASLEPADFKLADAVCCGIEDPGGPSEASGTNPPHR